MSDPQANVFWYFAGNRAQRVVIDGMPSLVSPKFYCLAPPNQKWPEHCAHLFKRKTPPKEIMDRFGKSGERAEATRRIVEKETRAIETARKDAQRSRAKARREGRADGEPLPMKDAIREEGTKKPPTSSEPKPESSAPKMPTEPKSESQESQSGKKKDKGKGKDKDKGNDQDN